MIRRVMVVVVVAGFVFGTGVMASQHVRRAGNSMGHEHIPPSGPAMEPNAEYPLKVHVINSSRHQDKYGARTEGSGNLLGEPEVGFDYHADCALLHNDHHDEFFQGRWKKQDKKIEVLTQQPGETNVEKCTLEVTLKAQPYTKENPAPKPPDEK